MIMYVPIFFFERFQEFSNIQIQKGVLLLRDPPLHLVIQHAVPRSNGSRNFPYVVWYGLDSFMF